MPYLSSVLSMTSHSGDIEEIRDYLLGTLSEEGRRVIDERLLLENNFLEELLAEEDELIDDYVNGDLAEDDRTRFEQHFLCTPERQQKIKFAFALNRYADKAIEPVASKSQDAPSVILPTSLTWSERLRVFWAQQSLALRYAATVAVIAFVVTFVWLMLPSTRAPKTFASVTLSITSGDRAEGQRTTRLKRPVDVDALKIVLTLPELPAPAKGYRIIWINQQGVTRPLSIVEQNSQSLIVVIPSDQLARGQNALHLFVTSPDGSEQRINGNYFFTVE